MPYRARQRWPSTGCICPLYSRRLTFQCHTSLRTAGMNRGKSSAVLAFESVRYTDHSIYLGCITCHQVQGHIPLKSPVLCRQTDKALIDRALLARFVRGSLWSCKRGYVARALPPPLTLPSGLPGTCLKCLGAVCHPCAWPSQRSCFLMTMGRMGSCSLDCTCVLESRMDVRVGEYMYGGPKPVSLPGPAGLPGRCCDGCRWVPMGAGVVLEWDFSKYRFHRGMLVFVWHASREEPSGSAPVVLWWRWGATRAISSGTGCQGPCCM